MNDTEKLNRARELITSSLILLGIHAIHEPDCAGAKFAQDNRHLPYNHPAFKNAPVCNCLLSRLAEYLRNA